MYRTLSQLCSRNNVLVSNEKYIAVDDPVYKTYVFPIGKKEKKVNEDETKQETEPVSGGGKGEHRVPPTDKKSRQIDATGPTGK